MEDVTWHQMSGACYNYSHFIKEKKITKSVTAAGSQISVSIFPFFVSFVMYS